MDFVYFLFSSRLHQELMGFRFVCFSVWLCRSPWGPAQVFLFANQLICKSLRAFFKLGNKRYGFCNTRPKNRRKELILSLVRLRVRVWDSTRNNTNTLLSTSKVRQILSKNKFVVTKIQRNEQKTS